MCVCVCVLVFSYLSIVFSLIFDKDAKCSNVSSDALDDKTFGRGFLIEIIFFGDSANTGW